MGEVIHYTDYQVAADRWLKGRYLSVNRMAVEVLREAFDGHVYESSLGFVDTSPCEMNSDSGDCS